MRRKEQYADEIIKMLERTKVGAWASNINLNTKDRVIEVCQNCVDSWSGRKFKDHCTTPPQALEQTRWIPVSERLPEEEQDVLIQYGNSMRIAYHKIDSTVYESPFEDLDDTGWYDENDEFIDGTLQVDAWMPLPEPYKGESEDTE